MYNVHYVEICSQAWSVFCTLLYDLHNVHIHACMRLLLVPIYMWELGNSDLLMHSYIHVHVQMMWWHQQGEEVLPWYVFLTIIELNGHTVAEAFYNGELENELRRIGKIDYCFKLDSDRDRCMEMVEEVRKEQVYPHSVSSCTEVCKRRGNVVILHPPKQSTQCK